jgi:hypothetical protein
LTNQLSQINNQITSLTNTVNTINTNINNIVNQYKPIEGFQFNIINFTDYHGNSATGNFHDAWYRPIMLQSSDISNDGVDLKYLLLMIRGINISPIPNNGNFFYSDLMSLPVLFVNNNNFRVYWNSEGTGNLMNTVQASYYIVNIPINSWSLGVKAATNQNVVNDRACFILMDI